MPFKSVRVSRSRTAAVVAGVFQELKSFPKELAEADQSLGGQLKAIFSTPGFKGELGETVITQDGRGVLLGLGKADDLDGNKLRLAGARLLRRLQRMQAASVRFVLPLGAIEARVPRERVGRALAEGITLANWQVSMFTGEASRKDKADGTLSLASEDKAVHAGLIEGVTLGEATNYARQLGATPPNICNPTWMAKEAQKLAKETGLKVKVIKAAEAETMGMGGLVNVGRGSKEKPCLIILEHKPGPGSRGKSRTKAGATLALVGKTITYDTGGYSLKISNGMKGMKYDKNGGMAVLGAMRAIAALNLPVRVVALLPAAENMVSEDAYRPDDIITMLSGATVEVTNTDAEGRLVLADALTYACREYQPTAIIDAATLTGGVVVALGMWSAGVFSNNDDLLTRLNQASEATGEKIWRLPLWEEHRDFMRARHADLWNSGPKRDGHPIQGAAFLSFFVDENIPWAHLDIAGVSAVDSDTDLYVQGPTGFGVRLLTEAARSFACG